MGVHGLWKLIDPSGKVVPLETLENKVLAVDLSIWLHQALKGFRDAKGAPLPNAHLLAIYHRVCKLLYYKIKPVFVFDGGVPALKKETIVRKFQEDNNLPGRALLLLDNAPSHPPEDELQSDDGFITTMFMPPNVTPLIQPMDQNVIRITKLFYRKNLLTELLAKGTDICTLLNNYTLRDAMANLIMAWNGVKSTVIEKCWHNILLPKEDDEENIPLSELKSRLINDEAYNANRTVANLLQHIEPMAKRNQLKSKNVGEVNRIQKQLLNTLLKHSAINKVLSERTKINLGTTTSKISSKTNDDGKDDIFKLPPSQFDEIISSSSDEEDTSSQSYTEDSTTDSNSPTKHWDIYTINEKSKEFKALPADVRFEILSDIKETRKQSSWGRIHEMPTHSDDFSSYQMKRLLKRQSVQASLEEAEKEMGGHSLSLGELESLLTDHGVLSNKEVGKRIAKDEDTRILYIKDVKKAIEEARLQEKKALDVIDEEEEVDDVSEVIHREVIPKEVIHKEVIPREVIPREVIHGEVEDDKLKEEIKSYVKPEDVSISEADTTVIPLEHNQDSEYERDLALAIQLSLENEPSTSKQEPSTSKQEPSTSKQEEPIQEMPSTSKQGYCPKVEASSTTNSDQSIPKLQEPVEDCTQSAPSQKQTVPFGKKKLSDFSFLDSFDDGDFASDESEGETVEDRPLGSNLLASAKNYMLEYSGLTPAEVIKIIGKNTGKMKNEKDTGIVGKDKKIVEKDRGMLGKDKGTLGKLSALINSKSADAVFESEKSVGGNETIATSHIMRDPISNKKEVNISKEEELVSKEIMTKDTKEQDEIEIMSGSDSDASEDFVEVSSSEEQLPAKQPIEVIVETNGHLEDDIFADIFGDVPKVETTVKIAEATVKIAQPSLREKIERNLSDDEIFKRPADKLMPGISRAATSNVKNSELNFLDKIKEGKDDPEKAGGSENRLENEARKRDMEKNKVVEEFMKATESQSEGESNDDGFGVLSTKQLEAISANLLAEGRELVTERNTKDRLATNLTDQMYQEAQELLELFGVPYIIAPMEAEAQCAYLEQINLTDGTITDDSDIWLFGGKTVYKNFFNQTKHVLEFRSESIHHHFKMTRYQFILLALLVGSDYTTGLQGIGPVTALEILAAFPPSVKPADLVSQHDQLTAGLKNFKSWFAKGKSAFPARATLRTKLKNVSFTETFPSVQVVQAYLDPKIDSSGEKFSWAKPDIVCLQDFAKEKFGWTQLKSDEILKPIVKRMEENKSQTTIRDFFKTKHKLISDEAESKMSKRVRKAIDMLGKDGEDSDEEEEKVSDGRSKSKKKKNDESNGQKAARSRRAKGKAKDGSSATAGEGLAGNSNKEISEVEDILRAEGLLNLEGILSAEMDSTVDTQEVPLKEARGTTTKKSRGRKSKQNVDESTNSEEIPAKKPRGRKPKTKLEDQNQKVDEFSLSGKDFESATVSGSKKPSGSGKGSSSVKSSNSVKASSSVKPSSSASTSGKVAESSSTRKPNPGKRKQLKETADPELQEAMSILNETKTRTLNKVRQIEAEVRKQLIAEMTRKAKREAQIAASRINTSEDGVSGVSSSSLGFSDISSTSGYESARIESTSIESTRIGSTSIGSSSIDDSIIGSTSGTSRRLLGTTRNTITIDFHKKEYIPQKQREKSDILRSKMRAIEVFRKSKQGPGYVKKRNKVVRLPKDDAGLSESSDDSN